MFKKLLAVCAIVLIVAGGIGFSFFSDEQWHQRQLFNQSLEAFGQHQQAINSSFTQDGQLPNFSQALVLNYSGVNNTQLSIDLQISTFNNQVTLLFGQGETPLAEQTIFLEPVLKTLNTGEQQVYWKCLNGSVLLKYRPKACRLGEAILIPSL